MAEITGGEALIRALKAEGVEVVFGLPGVHALPIYDALFHHPEIRHIAVRHEQAAAFMADGYSRTTGKPGVCITTTGPGAANTTAAMGTAYNDSIPILNIMTQVETYLVDKGKGAVHETKDQLGMFKTCTRWNRRVDCSEDVPSAVHEAFRQMLSGHPGPTAIEFCTDILAKPVDVEQYRFEEVNHGRQKADALKVTQAVEMLSKAKSPVLWIGDGAAASGASEEVRRLAELLQAPVLTSLRGNGIIPEDHPLYVGSRPNEPLVRKLLAESDLMLAIGSAFGWRSTFNWRVRLPQPLIQIDIDEKEIGKNYPAAIGLVGDAKAIIEQILAGLADFRSARPSPKGKVAEIIEQSNAWSRKQNPLMARMMRELREVLPRDAILVCDATKPANWVHRCFPLYEPRSCHRPVGYSTLGYGFPAALGAKVGSPNRKVVAICGDGGFQYCNQELATALQYGIDVTVLVFNDRRWGTLRDLQDSMYGGRRFEIELLNPDFVKLAEAYGAVGLRVDDPKNYKAVLEQALSNNKVTVVDLPMEDEAFWLDAT